jgi:small nuclear ribonucleoprotein (snRNP)-like protein
VDAVVGILKGYDQLMNLVLDEVKETMRGMLHPLKNCWCIVWSWD